MGNGQGIGGGCGLAAAWDFVFVGKNNGKLGTPEVKLGFLPAVILLFIIKRMGEGKAKEFVLRGEILDASAAKEQGLATEISDDDQLSSAVYSFAKKLANNTSASSVSLTKELFSRSYERAPHEFIEYAANVN